MMQALSAQVLRFKRVMSDHCVILCASTCNGYFHDELWPYLRELYTMFQHDFKTTFAALPVWKGGTPGKTLGESHFYSIPTTSEHPQEAYDFIRFFTTEGEALRKVGITCAKNTDLMESVNAIIPGEDICDHKALSAVVQSKDFKINNNTPMKWLNEAIGSFLSLLGLDTASRWGGSVQFFLYDVLKITFLLCLLIFIISYIQSYFPPERSKKILGRFHGLWANCIAALLGTVTPFCSCSSIPLFIGFTSAGLPLGVTFSFLISSPMVDLGSLVLLMSIFGAKVAVVYVIFGLIVAVIGGTIIEKLHMTFSEYAIIFYSFQTGDIFRSRSTTRGRRSRI